MNTDSFKFRVWCGSEYMNTETIFLLPSGELGFFVRSMGYPHYRKFNNQSNFTIEHCTGLRDRNGKLIYENDKVKTVTGDVGIIQWIPARCGFLVYFPDNDTCLVHKTQKIIVNVHDQELK